MSDGAPLQSLMGPPEGDRQARDEAPAEAEDVRLPQRVCGEDHHPQDCSPQDHQQVAPLSNFFPFTCLIGIFSSKYLKHIYDTVHWNIMIIFWPTSCKIVM